MKLAHSQKMPKSVYALLVAVIIVNVVVTYIMINYFI